MGDVADAREDGERFDAAMARFAVIVSRAEMKRTEAQIPALVEILKASDVPVIVLKGPVTRLRLYGPDEARPVADIDLLVSPRAFRSARRALEGEGFERVEVGGHSDALRRGDRYVDLHLALPYTTVAPNRSFEALATHVVHLGVAGFDVPVLDEAAHVLHLAMHAAQNGFDPDHRSLDEWRRGWESLTSRDRMAADDLAVELGAQIAWGLAQAVIDPSAQGADQAALLPRRKPGASLSTMWAFVRSPIPARLRWRAAGAHVRRQMSDDVLNAWRVERGLPPLHSHRWAMRRAKAERFARAAVSTSSRS